MNATEQAAAYMDGFRAGRLDRLIGIQSQYAWTTPSSADEYSRSYANGYRDGWRGEK